MFLKNQKYFMIFLLFFSLSNKISAQYFNIARIHYSGGGDWYADPSSLPNLINFISENTAIKIEPKEFKIKLTDQKLYNHTYLYITGHGNIRFNDEEIGALRSHLLQGAFLHADDNYGMNDSFRREMKRVFPDKEWVELPSNHPIYNCYYKFPNGLPKVHEHDNKPPQILEMAGKIVKYTTILKMLEQQL